MIENRVVNFSAGPSMLPEEVLKKAAEQMLNYEGSGMSVMEMSHRSKVYESIIDATKNRLRKIMEIPENYEILFIQGGATGQFAGIPLNLLKKGSADYALTGQFSTKAYEEAKKYGEISVSASSKDENFTYIPKQSDLKLNADADYFYYCANNTIYGTKWNYVPETGNVPLICDMSSCILSEKVDVSKFGIIYAGVQKNMGPAGVAVVIIRKDLISGSKDFSPVILDYKSMADNDSMYNTPPTYSIYVVGLVLEWLENLGGIDAMEKINREKASLLYNYLDNSKMFSGTAKVDDRSLMNITFTAKTSELEEKFVKACEQNGFVNIKGHRSVGGMRASIYNAMPTEGIKNLVAFMEKFEKENA
ncbi:MAG: 3-phosphoserine/phosphohydroxythreonine transaminase [Clostridia bacterium]